jgi:hypothetical protein
VHGAKRDTTSHSKPAHNPQQDRSHTQTMDHRIQPRYRLSCNTVADPNLISPPISYRAERSVARLLCSDAKQPSGGILNDQGIAPGHHEFLGTVWNHRKSCTWPEQPRHLSTAVNPKFLHHMFRMASGGVLCYPQFACDFPGGFSLGE